MQYELITNLECTEKRPVLLLLGFKPFERYSTNISGELAQFLNLKSISGFLIKGFAFDIKPSQIRLKIPLLVKKFSPKLIIGTGIYEGKKIRIENKAHNWYREFQISEGDPIIYHSTLPKMESLRDFLNEVGIPASISNDAGDYLCNYLFYFLMNYLASEKQKIPAGFIHLPSDWDLKKTIKNFNYIIDYFSKIKEK